MARAIDKRLARRRRRRAAAFAERVKSLMEDVPDLPNFSRFHDAFRDDPKSATAEGHMREAFFMAYDAANCEYIKLASNEIDERLKNGPELVSANFVIPYPPGFPIMVPGQVISADTIDVHAQAGREGDPRLPGCAGSEAAEAVRPGGKQRNSHR